MHLFPVHPRRTALATAALLATASSYAAAPVTPDPTESSPVVVTATRVEQSAFDIPAAINAVNQRQIQDAQPRISLSESALRVPGLVVQDRQDYAQGPQVSSRGFGSRTPFGIRGVRLIADGIPATMPDGQGQSSIFDLGSAQRIEVMRGPFSALYGNASGGVIQVFTEDGQPQPTVGAETQYGSFNTRRGQIKAGGQEGKLNYLLNGSRLLTDGFRDHSAARWSKLNGKLRYEASPDTSVSLILNGLEQPEAEDPLGLTRDQLNQDRERAVDRAYTYDTRKSVSHQQAGVVFKHRLNGHDQLRLMAYGGHRAVVQYLPFGGSFGLSSGGLVDLNRSFDGLDARWSRDTSAAARPLRLTLGMNYDNLWEHRRGYVNNLGTKGELRRDEMDRVFDFDQYAQGQWDVTKRWSLTAGVRHSTVHFISNDHYVTNTNPDDSGSLDFSSTDPVLGVLFHLTSAVNLYASYGQGFETPTFAELAYRSDGSTGLNTDLKPSTSQNYEAGVKAFIGLNTRLDLAVFHVDTSDDIVVDSSSNGRTTYRNAANTRRDGAELTVDTGFGHGLDGYLAYSYIDARFAGGALDGNRLPAVPASSLYAELGWTYKPLGFHTAVGAQVRSKVYVDDTNSASAGGFGVVNWRASFDQKIGRWSVGEWARVDNVFDRKYVGAVIVGDSNGRYYEPAPGRSYMVGVKGSYAF